MHNGSLVGLVLLAVCVNQDLPKFTKKNTRLQWNSKCSDIWNKSISFSVSYSIIQSAISSNEEMLIADLKKDGFLLELRICCLLNGWSLYWGFNWELRRSELREAPLRETFTNKPLDFANLPLLLGLIHAFSSIRKPIQLEIKLSNPRQFKEASNYCDSIIALCWDGGSTGQDIRATKRYQSNKGKSETFQICSVGKQFIQLLCSFHRKSLKNIFQKFDFYRWWKPVKVAVNCE